MKVLLTTALICAILNVLLIIHVPEPPKKAISIFGWIVSTMWIAYALFSGRF